jgi:hypothetical protein
MKKKKIVDFDKLETQGEYENGLWALLMGDEEYPTLGYKPIDIKNRIKNLLFKEEQFKKFKKKYNLSDYTVL